MNDTKRQRTINDVFGAVQELEGMYEVEKIHAMRCIDMDPAPRDTWGPDPPIEYLVRWKGYEEKDDTWETEGTLSKAQDALKEFQVRNFTEIVMFMQSALGDEKQRFSNLMESHEDVQRRSRGYSNGFNWIRNENLLLREKICEVKSLATGVSGNFLKSLMLSELFFISSRCSSINLNFSSILFCICSIFL